ncbi:MAG: GGDEF domain-containing protein [Treponema sp.]|nr:GGDEF domain-containing protein [Treponema sp.]
MKEIKQKDIVLKFIEQTPEKICYLSVKESIIQEVINKIKDDFVIIDLSEDFSPFKPFLNILSEYKPDDELVRQNAYSIQAETFTSFFATGTAVERYDLPIDNETVYEVNRFIKTIIILIKKLNKKNFFFLNSQNMYGDSIELLKKLEKEDFEGKLVFSFHASIKNTPKAVLDFLEEYNTRKNFLFLKEDITHKEGYLPYSIEEEEEHFNGSADFEEKLFSNFKLTFNILHNNRIFMSLEQLKLLIRWVNQNLTNFNFSAYQNRILSFELAMDCIACGMSDESILFLNDIIESTANDDLTTAAYFYLASIFYHKKSGEFAKKYALQARERLENKKDSAYYALLTMLEFQFVKRSDGEIAKRKYMDALEELDSHGFMNNYIATGLSIPWQLINDPDSRPFIEQNIENCMDIAKKTDNQHLYSTACHWKGIIHSHYGESEEAMKWYSETNRIRTEIGELGPMINIRNGLSYESLCRANYKDAYNLVNEIIKNLYHVNDYSRVIDVLKNISYALFFSHHFEQAYDCFVILLHFLHIFNLEEQTNNSFLPSTTDILTFKTIIDIYRGDIIHAQLNYSQIEQNYINITMEDKPLVAFIRALLYAEDGQYKEAEESICKSIDQFLAIKSAQAHKVCFICYEFAINMKKLGQNYLSEKYLQWGFDLAKEKKFDYYTKKKEKITLEDYLDGIEDFEELKIDLTFMSEKAEKELLLNQLHKRIHDYQFLNKVKTNTVKASNIKKYIDNSMQYIFEYTLADDVYMFEKKDEKIYTMASLHRTEPKKLKASQISKLFSISKERELSQFIYKAAYNLYFGNISQYGFNYAFVIIPSEQSKLMAENITTLNIALNSIQSQITIYKQDENLIFLSTTDTLSLLNNRHALQQYILCEGDKVRRYIQRKNIHLQVAIAFLDLDNFKFYNDTFGHNSGDMLITCFARLLKETCRQIDFIARFGGDEFVIVMVDTNESEAKRVYERLNEKLQKSDYFIADLKQLLGVNTLEIPKKRLLGFSMGVSTNFDIDEEFNLNKVLENADKALYYSKENCKGSCSIWNEIRDKIKKGTKSRTFNQ